MRRPIAGGPLHVLDDQIIVGAPVRLATEAGTITLPARITDRIRPDTVAVPPSSGATPIPVANSTPADARYRRCRRHRRRSTRISMGLSLDRPATAGPAAQPWLVGTRWAFSHAAAAR